ncbi:MucR family transcriptional regulator [Methylobacterium sp. NPDC080182]|uniref:MucR family transcriptional regulator n=1 Tax=Methylobacterium sp. NPDC080182 TaxID=3390590 RepID=UPI003D086628
MAEENLRDAHDPVELTSDIVAAYVANNSIPALELPNLIQSVHDAVRGLTAGDTSGAVATPDGVAKPSPAQIRKSIRHDGIVSFIDGKTYKTLKRHLAAHNHDPESYRDRYGLPADYPMVAKSYAERRSALAKALGLGRPGAMAMRQADGQDGAA